MADAITTSGTFQFELVSPERVLVSEQAKLVTVPGTAGDFGVLPLHSPLLSAIRPGVVTVNAADGAVRRIFVAGGFADVSPESCTVLAEEAVAVEELDRAKLQDALKGFEDDLAFAKDDALKLSQVQRQIEITRAKIQAAA
ncbi:MAG TPA: F0F1 ATP synthase subunit epsilon [Patescibacteria group bacterium]|nr:F0F1 ATP synthase subunit epsilon [Patescibacteria group bacterium]